LNQWTDSGARGAAVGGISEDASMRRFLTVSAAAAAALLGFAMVGSADEIKVGADAPDFTCKDQDGKDVALKDFKGKKAVILWFYPKALTKGCTKEGCLFRDDSAKFEEAGAQILGVSMDTVELQKKFADKEGFKYPLLADADGAIVKAYGIKNNGKTCNRSTVVIGKDGKIIYVNHKVDIANQNKALLDLLKP